VLRWASPCVGLAAATQHDAISEVIAVNQMKSAIKAILIASVTFVIGVVASVVLHKQPAVRKQAKHCEVASSTSDVNRTGITKEYMERLGFITIDERAEMSNLESLRSLSLPKDDLEVRVWYPFGLIKMQGFVLKQTSGQWSATHLVTIHQGLPRSKFQKTLGPPKSGWERCWGRLEKAGMMSLPDATEIDCNIFNIDGEGLLVETNRGGDYRDYMYASPGYAKCREAKQIIKIGKIISEEFGLPPIYQKP